MKIDKVFDFADNMVSTRRYSNSRLSIDEDVMTHTGFVVVMAKLLGEDMNTLSPKFVRMGALLMKATVHDWDEPITGDVLRSVKYDSAELKSALDEVAKKGMAQSLGLMELEELTQRRLYAQWQNSKNSVEGLILELIDLLAVVWKLRSEVIIRHNDGMRISMEGIESDIDRLVETFNDPIMEIPEVILNYLDPLFADIHAVVEEVGCSCDHPSLTTYGEGQLYGADTDKDTDANPNYE